MTATAPLYASSALGFGLPTDAASHWHFPLNAAGAPNGTVAYNDDPTLGGQQELVLTGYNPQQAVLASTGGQVPFSVDYLQVQVTYSIDDAASNYTDVSVLLLDGNGTPFAREPLYLLNAGDGLTTQGILNFTAHATYGGAPVGWNDLAGLQLALQITRSGAAGPDTFRVDAVGLVVVYTQAAPNDPIATADAASTGVTLRVYDRAGNRRGLLPWSTLTRTIVRNAAGALAATVPRSLLDWSTLPDEAYLRVAVNGVEAPDWYLLDDDGDDDADEGGAARPVTLGATGAAEILSWGIVYSWLYDPANPATLLNIDPTHGFADKTPGYILNELLTQAKRRGCFPHLTWSFTADVDSAGRGWPTTYSKTYDIGADLLTVVTGMSDAGWVDWEMSGFRLDLYIADTELAVDHPDLVLRLGKGVTQAPRKRTRKTTRSTILANGATGPDGTQGPIVEVSDPGALATWGRREGYEGRTSITDYGTLTAATQVSLSRQTAASESITLQLDPFAMPTETPALPRPGGYLRYDQRRLTVNALEPLRVASIAWDYGPDTPMVSVELADLWVDADVKRGRQLDAILNGSTANERVPTPPAGADALAPGPVSGLAVTSAVYTGPDGTLGAQVTATWIQVTQNSDGSVIGDLLGYDLEWRQLTVMAGSQTIRTTPVTLYQWSPVVPGELIDVRIRAVDRFGNGSTWSSWVTIRAGKDTTPPSKPSPPLVDNYLGLLRSRWDGAFTDGTARPADLARVEVHLSTMDGFTPDPRLIENGGTLAGSLFAPGAVFSDAPYGQTQFVRLVAVDTTGNRSEASDQASGATGQVVSADVFDGAVGSAKLADLAVTSAKINLLAVNTAQVGSLDVGKLVAGTMTAQVIVGGSLSTSADPTTTGGVQLNNLGIYAWAPPVGNAAPLQTVAIDTAGNATLVGRYRTGFAGRRIEIGSAGTAGRLQFYSPTGILSELVSYTEGTGLEALQLRLSNSTINLNTQDWTTYRAYKHQTNFRDSVSWQGMDSAGANTNIGQININNSGNGYASPRFQLMNYNNYAAYIKYYYSGTGIGHLEIRDGIDSDFQPVWASAFTVSSDAAGKAGIKKVAAAEKRRMLDDVLGLDVHRYHRKAHTHLARVLEDGGHEWTETGTGQELGLIAQTAPAQITVDSGESLGIDLYQMTTMVLAALQASHTELSQRLTALEKNGART